MSDILVCEILGTHTGAAEDSSLV